MKNFFIAGNWKMHTTPDEAATLARGIAESCAALSLPTSVQALVCPPFTNLDRVLGVTHDVASEVMVGAQNCHQEHKGAFTGEVSAQMLKAMGCNHVILGHSERRQYFGETDDLIGKKIVAALQSGLTPLYCVGETLNERQSGATFTVLRQQMTTALAGVSLSDTQEIVVAYEPVWAIGTGLAATSEQAQEAHLFIRGVLRELYGNRAESINIVYGGSLKPDNALELLGKPDVNGGLIGGASLQVDSFMEIIRAALALQT